ncbi:MAG: amidohydrolase family protein [Terricaulis sp.]|nr:amidohydrolase family protein [Terricaulis sp.]
MPSASSAAAPIVDCHAHVFTHRMPLAQVAWTHPDYEYSAEAFVADLDRHGVSFGVISAATLYGGYNDYTLAALAAHKRLRATVIADPSVSLREFQRWADAGVVGVRFALRRLPALPDLRGYEYQKMLNRLADSGLHVQLLARADQMPEALGALEPSGVRVVIDHFGGPEKDKGPESPGYDAIFRAIGNGRTWVKLSAAYRIGADAARACAQVLFEHAGPERLLWGSDAPFVGHESANDYQGALNTFEALAPDPAVRRAMSDAGLKLFFF